MDNKKTNKFKKDLNNLFKLSTNALEKYVMSDVHESEEPISYLKDILNNGCQSGIVSQFIYYKDTKEFFKTYVEEIGELVEEMEESTGEPLKIGSPIYNWLAWFGYEETARQIADKLNLEY